MTHKLRVSVLKIISNVEILLPKWGTETMYGILDTILMQSKKMWEFGFDFVLVPGYK